MYILEGSSPEIDLSMKETLKFVAACCPWIKRVGVVMKVVRIKQPMLAHAQVKEALSNAGVTRFPTIKTKRRIAVGIEEITKMYTRFIEDYKRFMSNKKGTKTDQAMFRRGEEEDDSLVPENMHRAFCAAELSFGAAASDGAEEPLGDVGDDSMMGKYRDMTKRRAAIDHRRGHKTAPMFDSPQTDEKSKAEDISIDDLVAQVTAPVSSDLIDKAFSAEGGSDDPHDALMVKSFWDNQEDSLS